jgi:hypothetical protein
MPLVSGTIIHKDLAGANLHTVFRQVFATEAERLADTTAYEAGEVNNDFALVVSNVNAQPQVYVLTDAAESTWSPLDPGIILATADDTSLTTLGESLAAADEGKLVVVADRSGQGPQLLTVIGGELRNFVALPATITISAADPDGTAVLVAAATDVNLAEGIAAGVRNEFPADVWVFEDHELVAPISGYVRTALTIQFSVSSPCMVQFTMQVWDGEEWLDIGVLLAQEVAPQTIPYQLTGFDEILAAAGSRYRIVARHDQVTSHTFTVYKAVSIINFVFMA